MITFILFCFAIISPAQNQEIQNHTFQEKQIVENNIYKLFPTKNFWTFIKLDTRNGRMWQVHFTIEKKGISGELVLNSMPLVEIGNEINGRFTLYPTENMYNFLLLDQIDGHVYQAQWSMDEKNRGVMLIY
ncbi:hypothetical protein [Plebeiibacterium sediminum]|uniref:Uncharacterized protein n=1 Tax=Plebeiibacterium sediminum TaxID=2992112 RepID=A0AAE3SHR7_9BACT|nr:hypothetical protein [Plebeiobacterium sediminum]MCW3789542.1 hypothetical protein [Plebeiobacterium sediminum]